MREVQALTDKEMCEAVVEGLARKFVAFDPPFEVISGDWIGLGRGDGVVVVRSGIVTGYWQAWDGKRELTYR